MIPDNVEKIIMTKEDYDRNVEQLLVDKCKAELEVERLQNIIKEVREYIEKEYVQVKNKKYNLSWNNLENIIKEILEILDKENK